MYIDEFADPSYKYSQETGKYTFNGTPVNSHYYIGHLDVSLPIDASTITPIYNEREDDDEEEEEEEEEEGSKDGSPFKGLSEASPSGVDEAEAARMKLYGMDPTAAILKAGTSRSRNPRLKKVVEEGEEEEDGDGDSLGTTSTGGEGNARPRLSLKPIETNESTVSMASTITASSPFAQLSTQEKAHPVGNSLLLWNKGSEQNDQVTTSNSTESGFVDLSRNDPKPDDDNKFSLLQGLREIREHKARNSSSGFRDSSESAVRDSSSAVAAVEETSHVKNDTFKFPIKTTGKRVSILEPTSAKDIRDGNTTLSPQRDDSDVDEVISPNEASALQQQEKLLKAQKELEEKQRQEIIENEKEAATIRRTKPLYQYLLDLTRNRHSRGSILSRCLEKWYMLYSHLKAEQEAAGSARLLGALRAIDISTHPNSSLPERDSKGRRASLTRQRATGSRSAASQGGHARSSVPDTDYHREKKMRMGVSLSSPGREAVSAQKRGWLVTHASTTLSPSFPIHLSLKHLRSLLSLKPSRRGHSLAGTHPTFSSISKSAFLSTDSKDVLLSIR